MKKFSIWLKENEQRTSKPQSQTVVMPAYAPTVTYLPKQNTYANNYHDHPIINKLLSVVKDKIDHLTWDYGKDTVEMAINSAIDAVPFMKAQCDQITSCWKRFKDALYKELQEHANPWWGPPRQGSPNPASYDVVLLNLRDIEKLFEEIKQLCSECGKEEINQLFLTFLQEYNKIMPGMKKQIEKFRTNTVRK